MRPARGEAGRWLAGFVLGLLAVVVATAFAAAAVRRDGPSSPVIYPEQSIPLRFFHDKHLKLGVKCELCHASARQSETPADSLLPDHRTCGICHQLASPDAAGLFPKASCDTCHPGFQGTPGDLAPGGRAPPRVAIPAANVRFSHARHTGAGVACEDCHRGMEGVQLATRDQLPTMPECVSCHTRRGIPTDCATCHLTEAGGALARDLPGAPGPLEPVGRFMPADHRDARWSQDHRAAGRANPSFCGACHQDTDCARCHDGVLKPEVHPGDWVSTHGREALTDAMKCASCHDRGSFCLSCHEAAGVTRETFPGAATAGGKRFHPEGWVATVPGADHHSVVARRGIGECVACHGEDQALCVQCHVAVNPHGPGFGASARARSLSRAHPETCLTCHAPGTLDALLGP